MMRTNGIKGGLLGVMIALLLVLPACGNSSDNETSPATTEDEVEAVSDVSSEVETVCKDGTVGVIIPLSGSGPLQIDPETAAIEVATSDANDALGEAGISCSTFAEISDSEFDASSIRSALEEFKAKDIDVVVFAGTSNNLSTVKSYVDSNDILLINNTSTASDLSVDDNIYRLIPDDSYLASVLAEAIYSEGIEKLFILYRGDLWGTNLADEVQSNFEALGGTVPKSISYSSRIFIPSETGEIDDLAAGVTTALATNTANQIGVLCLSYEEGIDILERSADFSDLSKVTWFGSDGFVQNQELLENSAAAEFAGQVGMYCPVFAEPDSTRYLSIKDEIQEMIGYEPYSWAMILYDAFQIASQVLHDDRYDHDIDVSREILGEVVEGYDGITGAITLNENGDRSAATYDFWAVSETDGSASWINLFTRESVAASRETTGVTEETATDGDASSGSLRNLDGAFSVEKTLSVDSASVTSKASVQSSNGGVFSGIDVGRGASPTFGDVDGDGDLDMLVGESSTAEFIYYENTGSATAPVYTQRTGSDNPFDGFKAEKYFSSPCLADLDGDGDLDLISGASDPARIYYWENTGTSTAPCYTQRLNLDNPFSTIYDDVWKWSLFHPVLADIDNDGDLDLMYTTERDNKVFFYRNTGNPFVPRFTNETGTETDPFADVSLKANRKYAYHVIAFGDVNLDGDLDMISSESQGSFYYYENCGTASEPRFQQLTGAGNPFKDLKVGSYGTPTMVDINGDGLVDIVCGDDAGTISFATIPPRYYVFE